MMTTKKGNGSNVICSRTKKPTTECGCEPSDHGLLCAILVSPLMCHPNEDAACHKPGSRSMRSGNPGEGICPECVESMLDGDFTTAQMDIEFPHPVLYGILIYDEGQVRWCSLGGMPKLKAVDVFADWDRVSGADGHRTYALGVFPYRADSSDLEKVAMVGKAMAGFERCRQELAWYADPATWKSSNGESGDCWLPPPLPPVSTDGGKRAYLALQSLWPWSAT
jgi:hypothetical protein